MRFEELYYPESRFGGFTDCDGSIRFYARVNALVDEFGPQASILDVGCGRGEYAGDRAGLRKQLRILKGKAGRVIGIDVDPAGFQNPYLDEFRLLQSGSRWPIADHSVDLCLADWVVEHISDPDQFFDECARVVKPGGCVCIRTVNTWNYVAIASRLIPNRHHAAVLKKAQEGRHERDVFPTAYRCNTLGALRSQMKKHGFDAVVYGVEGEPTYLSFSRFAYALGVLHQRLSPGILRPTIFAFGRAAA